MATFVTGGYSKASLDSSIEERRSIWKNVD